MNGRVSGILPPVQKLQSSIFLTGVSSANYYRFSRLAKKIKSRLSGSKMFLTMKKVAFSSDVYASLQIVWQLFLDKIEKPQDLYFGHSGSKDT